VKIWERVALASLDNQSWSWILGSLVYETSIMKTDGSWQPGLNLNVDKSGTQLGIVLVLVLCDCLLKQRLNMLDQTSL
jgi:hypothetical protein